MAGYAVGFSSDDLRGISKNLRKVVKYLTKDDIDKIMTKGLSIETNYASDGEHCYYLSGLTKSVI